jgi:predicted HTH transcriptional regulator
MSENELFKLLKQKESTHLEFKSRFENPHKAARILAAFSNTSGGTVLAMIKPSKAVLKLKK